MIRTFGVCSLTLSLLLGMASAEEKPAPTETEKSAMEEIRKSGGQVMELAQNDARLDVAFHLADGKIEDAQLVPLKNLPKLAQLNVRGKDISDAGLMSIKDCKGLMRLHLERTKVTDEGLVQLKGLDNLEYLNLYGTAVTDAGLKHLHGLKKLQHLYLWQTPVTTDGIALLKAAIPSLQVVQGVEPLKIAEVKPEEKKPEEKKPEEKKEEKK